MKETAVHAAALKQAHRSGIAVRKNGLRVFVCNRFEFSGDRIEGLVPRNSLELAVAFPAGSLHRIEKPIGVIGALLVMRDLYAQAAVRKGIRGITLDSDGASILVNLNQHGAGVGTIMRADSTNNFHFRFPVLVAASFILATSSSRLW